MPKPIIKGSLQPVRQRVKIQFDPAQGVTTTTEYESAGDNCGGLAASFQRAGTAYDLTSNPVRSRLVATQSRNSFIEETAVERWELLSNQQQLDVREHPNSVALGQTVLATVLKAVKNHEAGKTVDTDDYSANALSLFRLLTRGVTHYTVPQWVLRYTANVSNDYLFFTTANSGIGAIYTNAQAASAVPAGRMRSTIQSITVPTADAELSWGWLKTSVTETIAARNRIDISAEYWLAQWPIFLYG
jgi:hypothetical protein